MVLCAAFNCNVRSDSGERVPMYSFPKDVTLTRVWVRNLKTSDEYWPSKHSRLCIRHFEADQFEMDPELAKQAGYKKISLKPSAVPTIFDFTTKRKSSSEPESNNENKRPRSKPRSKAQIKRQALQTLSELPNDKDTTQPQMTEHSIFTSTEDLPPSEELPLDTLTPEIVNTVQTFTQTTYNLISRRHVSIQTNIVVDSPCTREMQTQTDITDMGTTDEFNESYISEFECDDPSDPDWTPEFLNASVDMNNNDGPDPAKERKFLVFESCLDKLFSTCGHCGRKLQCDKSVRGTCLSVKSCCECGESFSWDSQPLSGTLPLGNLLTAAAIMFAGCHPKQILTMFRHASIEMFCERTYNNLQTLYLVPAVTSVFQLQQSELFEEIKESGEPVRVGGDARCCSPGHTAKYGSYSVMDLTRSKILDIQLVQSNEVKNSYSMELEGLKRCLAFLMQHDLELSHLITDRHSQVKAYMKKEQPSITHWFDCWHVAKGIYKKLESAGKKRACEKLLKWARSISNHLYWCAASSDGDGDLVHDKWISILNHVTNVHEGHDGKYPACQHGQLDDRSWVKKDSKAFLELEKIVRGRLLVKDVKKISPAEQTSGIEAFHRVVCHFAPKLVHFFHGGMEARLYLAVLHFNENGARAQAHTKDGSPMFSISYPKSRKGEGVAKEVKVKQTFGYVDELMEHLLIHREVQNSFAKAKNHLRWSKVRPAPLSHSTPHRPKADIIRTQITRFNR